MLQWSASLAVLLAAGVWGAAGAPADEAKPETAESAIDHSGAQTVGRINSLGVARVLRMTVADTGKEIELPLAILREATFTPTAKEAGPHLVILTNGDRVAGKVVAVTATRVTVEETILGTLALDRSFVRRIQFRAVTRGRLSLVDFENGESDPFEPVEGEPNALAAEYPQDKPLTIQADFIEEGPPWCSISIFAASPHDTRWNAVTVSWEKEGLSIRAATNRQGADLKFTRIAPDVGRLRTLQFGCDPATGACSVQLNGRQIWNDAARGQQPPLAGFLPPQGRCIVIRYPGALPLRRFQVLAEDRKDADVAPEEDPKRDLVLFANGDFLPVDSVALADGRLSVKSDAGEFAVPTDGLLALTFRTAARKALEAGPEAVRVWTPRSILTLNSVELNDQALTGNAEVFGGPVLIGRALLKSLLFSWLEPRAAPSPAGVPGTGGVAFTRAVSVREQPDLTLVKLEKWEPRGEVESTRVHVTVDGEGTIRFRGEGGALDKEGKRWGRPAELVRVELPAHEGEAGRLTWLGPRHTFIAEPGWGVPLDRGEIGKNPLPGGEHILHGQGVIFGFMFWSDESYPLTFKFVSGRGYVYMCGKGFLRPPAGQWLFLGAEDTSDDWLGLLSDKDPFQRERASQALGYLASAKDWNKTNVVKALSTALLTDSVMEVRRNCAQSLGRIGDKTALDALNTVKPDEDDCVRMAVQEAVGKLSRGAE